MALVVVKTAIKILHYVYIAKEGGFVGIRLQVYAKAF
jgi:hypothetical protein